MSARNTLAAKKERRVARNLRKVLAAEAPREERDPLLLNRKGRRDAIHRPKMVAGRFRLQTPLTKAADKAVDNHNKEEV